MAELRHFGCKIANGAADVAADVSDPPNAPNQEWGPGNFTCYRHNGASVVDYIAYRGEISNFKVVATALPGVSDHAALTCTLPWARDLTVFAPPAPQIVYRWV